MVALGLSQSTAAGAGGDTTRRIVRWATAATLVPLPLWFIASALLAPPPAWRAEYRDSAASGGAGVVVHERQLSRYWDKSHRAVPGGLSRSAFVARWDACLTLSAAREVPFMLAADGNARFMIDGAERLRAQSTGGMRATRGGNINLEAGSHHLQVEFEPQGWPSIALLASFDGDVPRAVGSGELAAGVRATPPSDGTTPCRER